MGRRRECQTQDSIDDPLFPVTPEKEGKMTSSTLRGRLGMGTDFLHLGSPFFVGIAAYNRSKTNYEVGKNDVKFLMDIGVWAREAQESNNERKYWYIDKKGISNII
jgi:hypothetical protein